MKKILFLVFFTAFSISQLAYAQSDNKQDNSPSPWTIGVTSSGYIPTSYSFLPEFNNLTGAGGGINLKFKSNLNRIIGLATEFNYTHASKKNIPDFIDVISKSNFIDLRESFVIQYETRKGDNGFVPWFSIGAGFTFADFTANLKKEQILYYSGVGFNVNVGAGLRYNYKHFYTGLSVDYTYSRILSGHFVSDYFIIDPYGMYLYPSGVRVGVELGYRH